MTDFTTPSPREQKYPCVTPCKRKLHEETPTPPTVLNGETPEWMKKAMKEEAMKKVREENKRKRIEEEITERLGKRCLIETPKCVNKSTDTPIIQLSPIPDTPPTELGEITSPIENQPRNTGVYRKLCL